MTELDFYVNENYTQTFDLQEGIVNVKFQYAARSWPQETALETNGMAIYWNGALVKRVTPTDFKIHAFEISLPSVKGVNTFTIGGAGT